MSTAIHTGETAHVKRFYIGEANGKQAAIQTVNNIGRIALFGTGWKYRWPALGNDGHGADAKIATDVISIQTGLQRASGGAD